MTQQPMSYNLYEMVGGDATFERLVDDFYTRVENDTVLRPMFPDDLDDGKRWQFLFLTQYWGGPKRYAEERGHPRLRIRHMPYAITPAMRNRWVKHMLDAIDAVGIAEPSRSIMREYFERGATFMINREDEGSS